MIRFAFFAIVATLVSTHSIDAKTTYCQQVETPSTVPQTQSANNLRSAVQRNQKVKQTARQLGAQGPALRPATNKLRPSIQLQQTVRELGAQGLAFRAQSTSGKETRSSTVEQNVTEQITQQSDVKVDWEDRQERAVQGSAFRQSTGSQTLTANQPQVESWSSSTDQRSLENSTLETTQLDELRTENRGTVINPFQQAEPNPFTPQSSQFETERNSSNGQWLRNGVDSELTVEQFLRQSNEQRTAPEGPAPVLTTEKRTTLESVESAITTGLSQNVQNGNINKPLRKRARRGDGRTAQYKAKESTSHAKRAAAWLLWLPIWLPLAGLTILGWYAWRAFTIKRSERVRTREQRRAKFTGRRANQNAASKGLKIAPVNNELEESTCSLTETKRKVASQGNDSFETSSEFELELECDDVENEQIVPFPQLSGTPRKNDNIESEVEGRTNRETTSRKSTGKRVEFEGTRSQEDQSLEFETTTGRTDRETTSRKSTGKRVEFEGTRSQEDQSLEFETTSRRTDRETAFRENTGERAEFEGTRSQEDQSLEFETATGRTDRETTSARKTGKTIGSKKRAKDAGDTRSAASSSDDLTRIHGIGPATSKLLRSSGIDSFQRLKNTSSERLIEILSAGGSKFKLIDPTHWSEQASYASSGDWDGLKRWHASYSERNAGTSRDSSKAGTRSEVRSSQSQVSNSPAAEDNLTKISGVGRATQDFLNKRGIFSFQQIASMTSEQLDELFEGTDNRFQLLNTETWPQQAQEYLETVDGMEVLKEIQEISQISSTETKKEKSKNREQVK